jgi:hypothetical protein
MVFFFSSFFLFSASIVFFFFCTDPTANYYLFFPIGVRLYVNNVLIVDSFIAQSETVHSGSITLVIFLQSNLPNSLLFANVFYIDTG